MRIRPIARDDLDGLQALAQQAGVGFTSLPDNREFLAGKIEAAASAFEAVSYTHLTLPTNREV